MRVQNSVWRHFLREDGATARPWWLTSAFTPKPEVSFAVGFVFRRQGWTICWYSASTGTMRVQDHMMKNELTHTQIRDAKPTGKPYKLSDTGNLHLLVQPNGTKAWRWRFRLGGKENLFAIGRFPDMGLAEARKARDAARDLVDMGINPAHQRQAKQRQKLAAIEARRQGELLVMLRLRPDERRKVETLAARWHTTVAEALRRALDQAARREEG